MFIIGKLDAKEKGDTQNLTQNVFLKNLNIEGKVGKNTWLNKGNLLSFPLLLLAILGLYIAL